MEIFDRVCRTCNNERKNVMNIFETKLLAKSKSIADMLSCCQGPVAPDDKYPKEICYLCAKQLEIAYKFIIQCKKSKTEFDKILEYIGTQSEHNSEEEEQIVSSICQTNEDEEPNSDLRDESNSVDDGFEHEFSWKDKIIVTPETIPKYPKYMEVSNIQNNLQSSSTEIDEDFVNISKLPETTTLTAEAAKFNCSYCSKSFFTTSALTLHLKLIHKIKNVSGLKQHNQNTFPEDYSS